jgi:ParB family chromosome partitioning protein
MTTSRVMTIPIASIRPAKSNRPLSAEHVRDLAESFSTTTFATAIVVRPIPDDGEYKWEPVAGFHRIEAAKRTEQKELHAIVVEDATDLQLELIQIDENILRREFTPAQEARAMARRKAIYQEQTPGARRGGDRRSKSQVGRMKSFAKATAAATGRSITAINRSVARGDRISAEVLKQVQGTPLESGHFLDRLAKLSPDEQKQLIADGLATTKGPSKDRDQTDVEKDLTRLRRCWDQVCAAAREKFREEITASAPKKK